MDRDRLRNNLQELEKRIVAAAHKVGRQPDDVKLLAITKTVPNEVVRDLYELGIVDMGENRSQELKKRQQQLPDVHWHMVGRLQRNKVKDVVGTVALIHSLDRWELATEINKRAAQQNIVQDVLLQVNISGEDNKTGIEKEQIDDFLQEAFALKHMSIKGFMTMAPLEADEKSIRSIFRQLHVEYERCQRQYADTADIKYLSMGMSNDFELAIEEGANIVRIGSLLFV